VYNLFDPDKVVCKLQQKSHPNGAMTDMCIWSAQGRYAIASISGKKAGEN
jgi:hypothetical protein